MARHLPAASSSSDPYAGILPLVLAREIKDGIQEFLHTSFRPSTPGFETLITDFTADPDNLFRGPYVGIDLPFTMASTEAAEFFPAVPLGHTPYLHQRQAFERLHGDVRQSTIVATGTGSGKTECFLLPILDWCRRHAGEPGIKAIVVYPMNALAEDQAKRLAALIWHNPLLKGQVRAGMYADEEPENPAAVMREDDVVRAREVMHRQPPDILLTNYKMLDNLLIRPDRKSLWAQNAPDTLRYLVVDELHTFDGAQGTDLACLIRRLKARLQMPQQALCCVGTSATLGKQCDSQSIVAYASALFDEDFASDAVVTEDRIDMTQFAAQVQDRAVHEQYPSPEVARRLAREAHAREPYAQIAEVYAAWFGETLPADVSQDAWRVQLGTRLGRHAFLFPLLAALDGSVLALDELAARMQRRMLPAWTLPDVMDLLEGFVALIAFARRRAGAQDCLPFLTVRVHFWIRELNRMVVSLPPAERPETPDTAAASRRSASRLLHSRDLSADHPEAVLPVVHCRECGGMAWIALETLQGDGFTQDLDAIYRAYFSAQPSSRLSYLLPHPPTPGIVEGIQHVAGHVCRQCLHWHIQADPPARCRACGSRDLSRVWRSRPKWVAIGTGRQSQKSVRCAYCGSSTGTGIFGVSSTSIASTLVSLLFASKANGDPKLLAFGDSVQDVAHKAGFIEARSFRTLLRQSLAHWLSRQEGRVTYEHLQAHWASDIHQDYADPAEFVGAMTHVDLLWLESIHRLFESESDSAGSTASKAPDAFPVSPQDVAAVQRRLAWESFSETTFRSQFGRTLENIACLTLSLDADVLGQAAQEMTTEVGERLGTLFEAATPRRCLHFLLGVLHRMLHDGAVRIDRQGIDPVGALARTHGNWFAVVRSRKGAYAAYPRYGPHARIPLLPSLYSRGEFAALTDAGSSARWYPVWARKSFAGGEILRRDLLVDFYVLTFRLLTAYGLTEEITTPRRLSVWVVAPDAVAASPDAARLECNRCRRHVHIHPQQAAAWLGMRCLNPSCRTGTLHTAAEADLASVLKEQLRHGPLRRVNARDHTSMLETDRRRRIERQFMAGGHTWYPNLLSTTPTLELGVDIGDLSSVLLYAVPPSQANYVQRLGRAGRRDGNALGLTVVNAQAHDLFFWADPSEMIQGVVAPPGLYMQAYAILRRQFNAFALERLVTDTGRETSFGTVKAALDTSTRNAQDGFPLDWIEFVEQQGAALLSDFRALFRLSPQQELSTRLSAFVQAAAPEESFRSAVQACLQQVARENAQWRQRIRQLTQAIQTLRDTQPPPRDLDAQTSILERDRRAYRAIVRSVERQDVLELLTDFGILPNYAFPAEGIKLHSVVSVQDAERRWRSKSYEYVRPASAGLTELAPGARFYAEGHRVPIDAIDLRISEPETWRFCPVCPYMQRESDPIAPICPRCGSPQWRDLGQVHSMVRLKQVHAHATARDTRIGDDHEERTVARYARQLYPSFDPQSAQGTHLIPTLPQPFGFEFLPHVEFRDVNFGRYGEESLMAVAGQGVLAEGFLLCRRCGHVLSAGPDTDPEDHARHCPVRRQADAQGHRFHTFLYQAFRSEAVRMRLPIRNADETQIQSFTAALQLGMQRMFQGRVDHLRTFEMSLDEGGGLAHWLFLYDTVPGGTGYLEQLAKPEVFRQVLALALQTMQDCACNQDQEQDAEMRKDGCYRCLYGYRRRMRMPKISRDTAIRMVREVLACWPDLQVADGLEAVDGDQIEESELELRFLAWLETKAQQAGGRFRTAPVAQGKKGYLIQIGDATWEIEPQVDLDSAYSVVEPARADFLLRPVKGAEASARPVALFMDGWAYHEGRIALDVRQRMSIRDSGKLWIWSLTWDDVQTTARVDAPAWWNPASDLDVSGLPVRNDDVRALLSAVKHSTSAELLWRYLQRPTSEIWTMTAGQLSLWALAHHAVQSEALLERIDALHPAVRAYSDGLPIRARFGLVRREDSFWATGVAETDLAPMNENGLRPFLYLHENARNAAQRRFQWAGALRLFNLLQFLTRTYWLCATETDPLDFPMPPSVCMLGDDWDEALQYLHESARPTALRLRQAGIQAPEVGWDVLRQGRVVVQLEMAWPDRRVGILREDLPDALRQDLTDAGWRLFSLHEIDGGSRDVLSMLPPEEKA